MKNAHDFSRAATMTTLIRLAGALALVGTLICSTGCSTMSVQRDLGAIMAMGPAPQIVAKGQEFPAAERAAAQLPGGQAFRGLGDSMQPLYASGTAIVVTPCDFANLRKGMQVLYVNHDGFGVAHVLVGDLPNGWIAQGVGNKDEDEDIVTPRNFVGVISQVYTSEITPIWSERTARIAMNSMRTGAAAPAGGLLASAN
jgi:hypothetical protein